MGLVRNWNINQIPLSIALGNDRALQDKVFASQQNYLIYPQFGTVNYLSNFNHNTWHSGNFAIEKRYASGLVLNATFNWSKSLSNDDSLSYYTRAGKARTAYDQEKSFGGWIIYELPVGKGQRWLNRGGVLNAILGGWKVDVSENILSGIPITVGYAGSPNKYLTTTRVNALKPIDQAKTPNWTMGNRFPAAAQNPYFDMNAFAYPDSYTIGALGARTLQAPGLLLDAVFCYEELVLQGARKTQRPPGRAQSAVETAEPGGPRHDIQSEQLPARSAGLRARWATFRISAPPKPTCRRTFALSFSTTRAKEIQ